MIQSRLPRWPDREKLANTGHWEVSLRAPESRLRAMVRRLRRLWRLIHAG